jgi:PAS domain
MLRQEETEKGRRHPWRRAKPTKEGGSRRISALESELAKANLQLETVINEYEEAIEELQATREEVHVAVEELQNSTQELSEERDQLRGSLAEFGSQNQKLLQRLKETSTTGEELACLLDMLNIPVLQFGADLRLRLYTDAAAKRWHLVSADIGRHVADIASSVALPHVEALCQQALGDFQSRRIDVCDHSGRPMSLILRPFAGQVSRAVRIAVILLPQEFEPGVPRVREKLALSQLLASANARIQTALGGNSLVEVVPCGASLEVNTDREALEGVLVRSALAVQHAIDGASLISIAGEAVEIRKRDGESLLTVAPGSYVAIAIAGRRTDGLAEAPGVNSSPLLVPEYAIRQLGALYRVEYSPGIESRLTIYLPRSDD